jgi:hypothetical protein
MAAMPEPTLDGRDFAMVSSTASTVNTAAPTVFHYHERDGLLWGEYDGDTVRLGRFVGSRDRAQVRISFGHVVGATGEVVSGDAHSTLQRGEDGTLELVETFGAAGEHTSVCREVR